MRLALPDNHGPDKLRRLVAKAARPGKGNRRAFGIAWNAYFHSIPFLLGMFTHEPIPEDAEQRG
jgi:hypothetical protein